MTKLTFKWNNGEMSQVDASKILEMNRIDALDFLQDIMAATEGIYALLIADGGVFPGIEAAN